MPYGVLGPLHSGEVELGWDEPEDVTIGGASSLQLRHNLRSSPHIQAPAKHQLIIR